MFIIIFTENKDVSIKFDENFTLTYNNMALKIHLPQ